MYCQGCGFHVPNLNLKTHKTLTDAETALITLKIDDDEYSYYLSKLWSSRMRGGYINDKWYSVWITIVFSENTCIIYLMIHNSFSVKRRLQKRMAYAFSQPSFCIRASFADRRRKRAAPRDFLRRCICPEAASGRRQAVNQSTPLSAGRFAEAPAWSWIP